MKKLVATAPRTAELKEYEDREIKSNEVKVKVEFAAPKLSLIHISLSPSDRLKMEAARSIREDFLHQNSFHEIDTYTPLRKQYLMMKLVLAFYDQASEALAKGAPMKELLVMEVRERIGRYKYTTTDQIEEEYEKIMNELREEIKATFGKEDF